MALVVALFGQYPFDERDYGGVYSHLRKLTDYFKKRDDMEVHVVTLSVRTSRDLTVKEGNITIHYLSSRIPRFIASIGIDQYKVVEKISEIKPDLIHAHMTAPVYGFPAALVAGRYKVILTVHGIVREESKTWSGMLGKTKAAVYGLMEDYALRKIKHVIVITDYVREKIARKCKADIRVIPLGVDEEYLNARSEEKKSRLLFVGGIEPRKGLIHLLAAVKELAGRKKDVELHIAGGVRDVHYQKKLEEYVKNNNLENKVLFTGPKTREELIKEYGECSIFVLPSLEESEGIVLLEAMAVGKPVVASRVGGIPAIVEDGTDGLLFEGGNATELADRIQLLLEDKQLRERMGLNGRKKAGAITAGETSRQVYQLYREVAGL